MNIFRRRILVFQVHISENFRLRQIFISSYTIFHKTTKNSYTEFSKITEKSYKKKNVTKILIRIPYKNSYKHYFKFPDLEKKGLFSTGRELECVQKGKPNQLHELIW